MSGFRCQVHAADDESVRQLIEERAELVRSACDWRGQYQRSTARRPQSRDQVALAQRTSGGRNHSVAEFAAAVRGRL